MKKINFCKATTIILIINVILSIVLFFVVPDNIAIQWAGTSPRNAVDSYYIFLVPVGSAGLEGQAGAAQVLQFVDFPKMEKTGLLRPV